MQLTEGHRQYWRKNLHHHRDSAGDLVRGDFVVGYYARDLNFNFFGWPFSFWMAAQGSLIIYVVDHLVLRALHEQTGPGIRRGRGGIDHGCILNIWRGDWRGRQTPPLRKQLNKVYAFYTGGFIAFVLVLAILEQFGLKREWIGFIFLMATIGLYAGIGIMSRTTDAAEYYVAGRRVPALYNGMATGADWMSAASFIGMAGTLYLTGYGGLAFIMGWTGG